MVIELGGQRGARESAAALETRAAEARRWRRNGNLPAGWTIRFRRAIPYRAVGRRLTL